MENQMKVLLAEDDKNLGTILKAYLEAKAWGRKHGEPIAKCREAFIRGYHSGKFCQALHEQLGDTSWKTLERWAVELRRADYHCEAIAPRYGLHRQGVTKVTPEEEERLLALLLSQSQFKIGTAIALMKMDLERQGIASPSSSSTLRNWAVSAPLSVTLPVMLGLVAISTAGASFTSAADSGALPQLTFAISMTAPKAAQGAWRETFCFTFDMIAAFNSITWPERRPPWLQDRQESRRGRFSLRRASNRPQSIA